MPDSAELPIDTDKIDSFFVASLDFWRGQFRPRASVFLSGYFLIPVILGVVTTVTGFTTELLELSIKDAASIGLSYSSISLAACLTGLVLALTLPSPTTFALLCSTDDNGPYQASPYGDLIFTFTWAAMCQVALIATSVLAASVGHEWLVWQHGAPWYHVTLAYLSVTLFFYAVAQILNLLTAFLELATIVEWKHRKQVVEGKQDETLT